MLLQKPGNAYSYYPSLSHAFLLSSLFIQFFSPTFFAMRSFKSTTILPSPISSIHLISSRLIMHTNPISLTSFVFFIFFLLSIGRWRISEASRVFTLTNDCRETIWPAIIPGDSFEGGGFPLKQGQSRVFTAPIGWSGRIWARTGCNFDQSGNGTCATGACGTSLKCGAAGKPPATLAEFTLAKVDFYDVSLVDGFNIPVSIKPLHGAGNCTTAGCNQDLRKNCPKELSVKAPNDRSKTVACRSACDVFDTDEYCCRGLYGGPSVCHPTYYSKLFKQACPTSYSYAYDDPTSIFTCTGTDYIITFCSSKSKRACTYHDNKLICSGSKMMDSHLNKWWSFMFALLFFVTLRSI